ncbi:MAG: hypothetical protein RJA99_1450 [Pseudomonadota bacterium]|jgi:DNA-binding GntR family transcriptional regulator
MLMRHEAVGGGASDVDAIVARLETEIVEGRYLPGARLREQALAETLGVGRAPLREAVRVLEGRRMIERTPNAGVRVADPSVDDLEQMLVVREGLEGLAAREAAGRIGVAGLARLREISARIARLDAAGPAGTAEVFRGSADGDFHRSIAQESGNRWLVQLLCDDLYPLIRLFRFRAALLRPDRARTHAEHDAIIARLQARDAAGAERLMREHVRASRERLIGHLRAAEAEVRRAG